MILEIMGSNSNQVRACSKSWKLWMIDVKSFLAGMLLVLFVLVFQQIVGNLSINPQLHAITYLDLKDNLKRTISTSVHEHEAGCTPKIINNHHDTNTKSAAEEDHAHNGDFSDHETIKDELQHSMDGNHNDFMNDAHNIEDDMVIKKQPFHAYGHALALFVHMASYRGGPDSFAIIGLGAKPTHIYGNAGFECEWVPAKNAGDSNMSSGGKPIKGATRVFLPDWNMGRQYTVVVVNCSFEEPVGVDRMGGKLVVYALYGEGSGMPNTTPERFVALAEKKNEYDAEKFLPPYPYDYVYCGSPLYGELNAQRIREWMAYHAKVLGERAHFFLYDAGGVTESVARVLHPWRKRGYVTVQDIREEEKYDGYYHNQFLVVNDCLHRVRFLSNWTFFFDVDEYLWLPSNESLGVVMEGFSNYTQVIFRQKPMAAYICQAHLQDEQHNISRKWALEKLVYRNVKAGMGWDRKYAIQPRNAFTTGVHRSDHIVGNDIVRDSLGYFPESLVPKLWYYHFHNTITYSGKLCRTFVHSTNKPINASLAALALEPADFYDADGTPFRLDTNLAELVQSVKDFELQQVGVQPAILD